MSLDNLQNKLKIQIKLCITRLCLMQQKIMALHKSHEKELAILSGKNMKQILRIKAENMIRENTKVELFGILNLYCEILFSRFYLLKKGDSHCDEQIEQAVRTLIYAAPRCDIKELHNINGIFRLYFGKEFIQDSIKNKHGKVDPKVIEKLANKPLSNDLVNGYLDEILRFHNIKQDYDLDAFKIIDDTILDNKELGNLLKNNNSLKSVISPLSSDDSEFQSNFSSICSQNNYNDDNSDFINFSEISKKMSQNMSNNVSNIDQLRARFERLK
ncbi:hypothetical protein PMAC_000096 [Pneumocystis sp. 'macacae']|nr:hypothetical protein PMAC_000096 [Pneumocystis sp. 'macacae']